MNDLKGMWDEFDGGWEGAKEQYEKFLQEFPPEKLDNIQLSDYTSLKEEGKANYFTYWLERGTESCGKFRTASSYAYGIYKVNPLNKPANVDSKKWEKATEGYRTGKQRKDQALKDEFVSGKNAEDYFEEIVKPKLISLAKFEVQDDLKPLDINYCRKVAYLYNPHKLIPIYKKEVIESIALYFGVDISDEKKSYKITNPILNKISELFELKLNKENGFEITQKLGAFLWEKFGKSFALESKNIILHGAPGTGKTYAVENGIKEKLQLEVGEEYEKYYTLQQFHPSFGYEEFIDGVKPADLKDGQMEFKLVNGIFKEMCIKAAKELKSPTGIDKKARKFYFVADEINRAELSRVFGEVLLCLEEDKRLTYKNGKWEGTKVKTLNSALWGDDDAVITVDGDKYFGVPENLYFIGTMNDIDRSVDSFDMALRRRFLWKHYQCEYSVIAEYYAEKMDDDNTIDAYRIVCKNLNEHIIGKSGFDLGESFQLGHSYFLEPKKLNKAQINETWENHIKPLLREYLRSSVPLGEIENHLKEAKKIFQLPASFSK